MRILITGGDHTGKDSLARDLVLASKGTLIYTQASSFQVATLVPEWQDGRDLRDWWERRREHRQEWIDRFNDLRRTHRPAIFATHLFHQGESIVTGLRFTSELIDFMTTDLTLDAILWCRYSRRTQGGHDALTLDLTAQLAAIGNVPVFVVWSNTQAPFIWRLLEKIHALSE